MRDQIFYCVDGQLIINKYLIKNHIDLFNLFKKICLNMSLNDADNS